MLKNVPITETNHFLDICL